MRVNECRVGGLVVVDLVGSLTGWGAAEEMRAVVRRHSRAGAHTIVADLARVRAIDLAGLCALIDGYTAMRRAGGEMRLASLTRRIDDLVVVTRLVTVFNTFASVEQAIAGSASQSGAVEKAQVAAISLGIVQRAVHRVWSVGPTVTARQVRRDRSAASAR